MDEKSRRNIWQSVRIGVALIGTVLVVYGICVNQALWTAVGFASVLLVYYLTFRSNRLREAWFNHSMTTVVRNIERANNYAVQRIPIGIGVFDKEGHLQWRNRLFNEYVTVDAPSRNGLGKNPAAAGKQLCHPAAAGCGKADQDWGPDLPDAGTPDPD